MFFLQGKTVGSEVKLEQYKQKLERVNQFKCLGLRFDERLTWAPHIQKLINKCK